LKLAEALWLADGALLKLSLQGSNLRGEAIALDPPFLASSSELLLLHSGRVSSDKSLHCARWRFRVTLAANASSARCSCCRA
jgi:hypothetical protein